MDFKIQRIVIYVSNPIRCASFYRDHFLFKATNEWNPDWAEVDGGSCKIGFHQAYDKSGPVKTPTGSPNNPHKVSFLAEDVDGLREKLVAKGIKMSEIKNFDGWRVCTGFDCEGHAFQLTNR